MINGLEGLMGGGKSYEAVRYHILPALKKGRKVITNLPLSMEVWEQTYPELVHLIEIRTEAKPVLGTWDAEAANRGELAFRVGEFQEERLTLVNGKPYLPPPKSKAPFSGVWCFYDEWRGERGIGPLYVIDECHVSFPRPKPLKGIDTPDEVIQFFKLSRHFGVDMLLATQRFKAVHEDIRELIQIHHRVMKALAFGDPNSYIKKTLNGYCGPEVSKSVRKYESLYFALYKSHTQGQQVQESEASDVTPFIKKFRRFTWAFCGFTAIYCAYAFWPSSKPEPAHITQFRKDIKETPPGQYLEYDQQGQPVHVTPKQMTARQAPASQPQEPVPPKPAPEEPKPDGGPMDGKTVHLSGSGVFKGKTSYIFEVSNAGQRILTLTSDDLKEAGYTYRHLAHCMGTLKWKDGKEMPVICDAPRLTAGMDSKPVVIADSSRGRGSSAPAAAPAEPDYPHPFTAASKTTRLAATGSL